MIRMRCDRTPIRQRGIQPLLSKVQEASLIGVGPGSVWIDDPRTVVGRVRCICDQAQAPFKRGQRTRNLSRRLLWARRRIADVLEKILTRSLRAVSDCAEDRPLEDVGPRPCGHQLRSTVSGDPLARAVAVLPPTVGAWRLVRGNDDLSPGWCDAQDRCQDKERGENTAESIG